MDYVLFSIFIERFFRQNNYIWVTLWVYKILILLLFTYLFIKDFYRLYNFLRKVIPFLWDPHSWIYEDGWTMSWIFKCHYLVHDLLVLNYTFRNFWKDKVRDKIVGPAIFIRSSNVFPNYWIVYSNISFVVSNDL